MTKVLYVDDDDDIREIALMALSLDAGFEVRGTSSGREALAIVADWRPDIVLLDVMMPGMDGPSTLAALQARQADAMPIVLFCTARAQARDFDHYRGLGAAGVICKPFDPMMLAGSVRKHLA